MIKNTKYQENNSINYEINNNEYIFINNFFQKKNFGQGFIYQNFINQKLIHTIISDNILWKNEKKEYLLFNYQECYLDYYKNKEILNTGIMLNYNFFTAPSQFMNQNFLPENLITKELKKLIQDERKRGGKNLNLYLNELYQRSNLPISTFILTILAFLVSSIKKNSKDIGKNIVLGIIIAFFYIFFIELFKSIFINEDQSSIVAIFIPNILFGIITLFFLLIKS